jgi:hypothetical protein
MTVFQSFSLEIAFSGSNYTLVGSNSYFSQIWSLFQRSTHFSTLSKADWLFLGWLLARPARHERAK